jgi:predicted Fe-S protein YdhL (DUF1289 family)
MSGRIQSPCNEVCYLDRDSGWCLGCGRTGDEIAAWAQLTDEERDALMAQMPARLEALGLPSDPAERVREGLRRAREQRMGRS